MNGCHQQRRRLSAKPDPTFLHGGQIKPKTLPQRVTFELRRAGRHDNGRWPDAEMHERKFS